MYGKVFQQIYDGSLVENWKALVTFQQMIVLCDADGVVDMTHEALSRRTGIPIEVIREGIAVLEAPDVRSRTPDQDGRRIERMDEHRDWGWSLINHKKYQMLQDAETVREQNRERQRQFRTRNAPSRDVTPSNACNAPSRHTDTDTDTDIEKKKTKRTVTAAPSDVSAEVWADWTALRNKKRAAITSTAVSGIRREADKAGLSLEDALRMCCERGWSGFRAEWVGKGGADLAAVMRQLEAEGR